MGLAEHYSHLRGKRRPVVTNAEAAVLMGCSPRTAGKRLRSLEKSGLITKVRQGLWLLDPELPPFALAPYLTAPQPACISMISALAFHDMIEQIPRHVTVVSPDRSRTIKTTIGQYRIHQIDPRLFGGFTGDASSGYVAGPEKAIFDSVYIRAAAGSTAWFPELTLPAGFDPEILEHWTARIGSRRLRSIVETRLLAVPGIHPGKGEPASPHRETHSPA